jgi:hypothetical protein
MELWKNVVDYEGKYEVSNFGRVRSLLDCRGNILSEPRILKDAKNNRDYHVVQLCKDGVAKSFLVHRLVIFAFIGPPENDEMTVDHIDNTNKSNNHLSNLRWATREQQMANRTTPITINSKPGKSNEKYIHYMPKLGKYRVYNKRHNPVLEYFTTREDAIIFRNNYLEEASSN